MDEIEDISRRVCCFSDFFALKWRRKSKCSDLRLGLKEIDFEKFDTRAKVRFADPIGVFHASTWSRDGGSLSFEPNNICQGLMISVCPSPNRAVVSLKRTTRLTNELEIEGSVCASQWDEVPKFMGGVKYESKYWKMAYHRTLVHKQRLFDATGVANASLSVFNDRKLAKIVWEVADVGYVLGLKVKVNEFMVGVVTNDKKALDLMMESGIGERWKGGVKWSEKEPTQASIIRAPSLAGVGVRYKHLLGYTKVAWQCGNVLAGKWKCRLTNTNEVSVSLRVAARDLTKPRIGISWCLIPDPILDEPSIESVFMHKRKPSKWS